MSILKEGFKQFRTTNDLKQRYVASLFAQEDEILKRVRYSAGKKVNMQLSAQEGKFLHFLIKLSGAKLVLEIGTFVSYSAIWIARALPTAGKLVTLEKNNEHYNIAKDNIKNSDVSDKVTIEHKDAKEYMKSILTQGIKYDAIFIDGRKVEYLQY